MQGRYNCAKDFKEGIETIKFQLPQQKTCYFCNAHLFLQETSTMCCKDGKISLPNIPIFLNLGSSFVSKHHGADISGNIYGFTTTRSEERRVGKEC